MIRSSSESFLAVAGVVAVIAAGLFFTVQPVEAQVVSLRTTPLAAGDQFDIFPGSRLGMGSPTIALSDELLDPFVNPAKGSASDISRVFGAPTQYTVSGQDTGARTFPVGMHLTSGDWFGGGLVAFQRLDMRNVQPLDWRTPVVPGDQTEMPGLSGFEGRSAVNNYVQMSAGRRLGENVSVAMSAMLADIDGTDGVEQLFVNAWEIDEFGHMTDLRLGLTARFSGDRLFEAVLVHNVFDMTHDITSVAWELVDTTSWLFAPEVREESNRNRSSTWGAHLGYRQPLGTSGWQVGGILTTNRKLHPKIPTYDLATVGDPVRAPIPRDPGDSWAFNAGLGLSYTDASTTFGLDMIYEPAVSDTWANSTGEDVAADGTVIPAGGHTVDNHFVFSNARVNVGVSQDLGRWNAQFGIRMQTYDYRLDQEDHVLGVDRRQTEQWTEWMPTWGVRFPLDAVELRYIGHASSASHFPLPSMPSLGGREILNAGSLGGGDTLAPPPGEIVIPDETIVTHRFQISIPIH